MRCIWPRKIRASYSSRVIIFSSEGEGGVAIGSCEVVIVQSCEGGYLEACRGKSISYRKVERTRREPQERRLAYKRTKKAVELESVRKNG